MAITMDCLSMDEVSITSVIAIMNLYSRLVQLVEGLIVNQEVVGSNPVIYTTEVQLMNKLKAIKLSQSWI